MPAASVTLLALLVAAALLLAPPLFASVVPAAFAFASSEYNEAIHSLVQCHLYPRLRLVRHGRCMNLLPALSSPLSPVFLDTARMLRLRLVSGWNDTRSRSHPPDYRTRRDSVHMSLLELVILALVMSDAGGGGGSISPSPSYPPAAVPAPAVAAQDHFPDDHDVDTPSFPAPWTRSEKAGGHPHSHWRPSPPRDSFVGVAGTFQHPYHRRQYSSPEDHVDIDIPVVVEARVDIPDTPHSLGNKNEGTKRRGHQHVSVVGDGLLGYRIDSKNRGHSNRIIRSRDNR